jgi:hypothetical protein
MVFKKIVYAFSIAACESTVKYVPTSVILKIVSKYVHWRKPG